MLNKDKKSLIIALVLTVMSLILMCIVLSESVKTKTKLQNKIDELKTIIEEKSAHVFTFIDSNGEIYEHCTNASLHGMGGPTVSFIREDGTEIYLSDGWKAIREN